MGFRKLSWASDFLDKIIHKEIEKASFKKVILPCDTVRPVATRGSTCMCVGVCRKKIIGKCWVFSDVIQSSITARSQPEHFSQS